MPDKSHRILFTGGSGKAGKHVVPWLLDQGHRVVNVDLTPLDYPGVDNLTANITDSGQMFNVLSSLANFDELELERVPQFDAVVHFAAVPHILMHPDNETYRVNTIGTDNVIEAAVKLGIKKLYSPRLRPPMTSALRKVSANRTICPSMKTIQWYQKIPTPCQRSPIR